MLDLLMLLLFVLISNPTEEQMGISYAIVDKQLPPDSHLFLVDLPNPTRYFDIYRRQWIENRGHFNSTGNTLFAQCNTREECLHFLPASVEVPEGQFVIGLSGKTMENIQKFTFETCSDPKFKRNCNKLKLFVNKHGEVSLKHPKN
ncbi:MAG: hypothetical protein VSS75_006180 [Candidatus Parabeggiatoa sp.]|nr:hypothetical protein [Candidatus Parabeggiatoa sp.]